MRLRLSTRLILGVVIIEALMLGLLVWNSVRLINSSHAKLLEQSTREQSLLLANSLAPGLAFDDRAVLRDVLALLQDKQNLAYAAVYSADGRLFASLGDPPHPNEHQALDRSYRDAQTDGVFDVSRPIEVAGQLLGEVRVGYSIDEIEALTNKTGYQNTAIATAGLVLSVAATIVLGLVLTRHLRQLELGADALRRGRLEHRIHIRSNDEIGDLANGFNQLASHLEQTQAALDDEHRALEREKRHLDTLLNGIKAIIWECEPGDRHFRYMSREAEKILGYSTDQLLQVDFFTEQIHPHDRQWVSERYIEHRREPGTFTLDYRMFSSAGRCLWMRDIVTSDRDANGRHTLRGLTLDVTDEKAAEESILYLAEHDALTGLINRRRFQDELEQHVAYAQRYGHSGALLFIDLDQFKYVNDTFGHQEGDQFLIKIAEQINRTLRTTDLLGRLGGDEFGVLLPKAGAEEAPRVAEALLTGLSNTSVELNRGRCGHVSASIGIALFPDHGTSAGELLAKADAAMYAAKDKGRKQYYLFDESEQGMAHFHAKVHWEERIRHALEQNRFVLHYQPVVDLTNHTVVHYEALLRMVGDDNELIGPGAFLEVAERFGLIREIDHWVLETTIQAQAEKSRNGSPFRVAVNLSGRHFGQNNVLELVQHCIDKYGADPNNLIFEVTETAAVENLAAARTFIEALRALGCRFALDDFGIGFSSFYYLKHLPVDFVKIDGSFVRYLHRDPSDSIFVKTMTDLAHGLGITTIAECIEQAETVDILKTLNVDMGQGYQLGYPQAIVPALAQPDEETAP